MPPPLDSSSAGCRAVWSISHQRGYCCRESTVGPPHPCAPSCGTTRNPPGPPPPAIPTIPPHPPTPTPPPKAVAPPRDSGGSAGPTWSPGSCESGPGQSSPSRAWSDGPARGRWRTAGSSQRGAGCHRLHGKPCRPMPSTPREPIPATSPRPRTTRMPSGACGRPSRRREEKAGACGTSFQAQPRAHTPARHPASVDGQTSAASTAPREPHAPHSTTRLTPRPAAPPPNPSTKAATAAERHTEPRPEKTRRTRSR